MSSLNRINLNFGFHNIQVSYPGVYLRTTQGLFRRSTYINYAKTSYITLAAFTSSHHSQKGGGLAHLLPYSFSPLTRNTLLVSQKIARLDIRKSVIRTYPGGGVMKCRKWEYPCSDNLSTKARENLESKLATWINS